MNFAWKFVLPLTLLNLLVAALWRFMGEGWVRWVVCSAILLVAYAVMGGWACAGSTSGRGVTGMRSESSRESDIAIARRKGSRCR